MVLFGPISWKRKSFAFKLFYFRSTRIDDLKANRHDLRCHKDFGAKLCSAVALQDYSWITCLTVLTECKCVTKVSLIGDCHTLASPDGKTILAPWDKDLSKRPPDNEPQSEITHFITLSSK